MSEVNANGKEGTDKRTPWDDPETLYQLYWTEEMSLREIGDELGTTFSVIRDRMDEFDIPRRDRLEATDIASSVDYVPLGTDTRGYEILYVNEGWRTCHHLRHHRLLMLVDHELEDLDGMHVHHKNGIPWDNRPENLELLTHSEHSQLHNSGKFEPEVV